VSLHLKMPADLDLADAHDELERRRITGLVEHRVGQAPVELRLLRTDVGLVVFLSVRVGAATTLHAAHELASRVEDDIRRDSDYIANVVVHTDANTAADQPGEG
jgi:divalent metal cation (Fe/Co/Zn/Cd) transporter